MTTLFSLTSCSYFLGNFEKDIFDKNKITPISLTQKTICDGTPKYMAISENEQANQDFKKFINRLDDQKKLSFVDQVVLWSLLQMNFRPDLSSPTAKLQMIITYGGKETYLNSFHEGAHRFPYLKALDTLLKQYSSKYSLSELAMFLDMYYGYQITVSPSFEKFLSLHKEYLKKHEKAKKAFFRGDEHLRESESIPKEKFSRVIRLYNKDHQHKDYKTSNFLFHYGKQVLVTPNCNFDMDLYDNSIFLINDKNVQGNIFGLKDGNKSFFAVSSQEVTNINFVKGSLFFQGNSNIRSAAICTFKHKLHPRQRLWLISTDSRDPGQHLFHLLQYGIDKAQNISELSSTMRFSRHLFLKDPVRLIIESRRSSEKQLDELLKLNIPIYNAKKLGTVWGFYQDEKNSTFILDDRRSGHIQCN